MKLRFLALAGCLLVSGLVASATPAMAQEGVITRECRVDEVAVLSNRIHIKCVPLANRAFTSEIPYYAMRLNEDARKVDNIIALAIAAKQNNRPMTVWVDLNDYASVPGCQGGDCRRLVGAALR